MVVGAAVAATTEERKGGGGDDSGGGREAVGGDQRGYMVWRFEQTPAGHSVGDSYRGSG